MLDKAKAVTPELARAKAPDMVWEDPFLLEDQLSEDERMIRDSAHQFCQERLMTRVLEANRHETFDRDLLRAKWNVSIQAIALPCPCNPPSLCTQFLPMAHKSSA